MMRATARMGETASLPQDVLDEPCRGCGGRHAWVRAWRPPPRCSPSWNRSERSDSISSRALSPCSELSTGSSECVTHSHGQSIAFSLACSTSLRVSPAGQVDHNAVADTPVAAVRRSFDHDVASLELRSYFSELSGPLPNNIYDDWRGGYAPKRDLRHHVRPPVAFDTSELTR
jgi:hypothetical protein